MARNVINRDLPFNEDAERVVLGSILLSKDALYKVLSALSEEDFYVGKHQLIFRAIVSVQIKRIDIDVLTVTGLHLLYCKCNRNAQCTVFTTVHFALHTRWNVLYLKTQENAVRHFRRFL